MASFSKLWMWEGRLLKKFSFYSGSQGRPWPLNRAVITLLCVANIWLKKTHPCNCDCASALILFSFTFMWNISFCFVVFHEREQKSTQSVSVFSLHLGKKRDVFKAPSRLAPEGEAAAPNRHAVPGKGSGAEHQASHGEHLHRAT